MIYFVTNQTHLFDIFDFKNITAEESIKMIDSWGNKLQVDSETNGRDAHICDLLCFQIGDFSGENQVVIDCTTVDIRKYKDILESHVLIGHNLKFDLQFLYKYQIVPRNVYDTMVVEQFLHLGYPPGSVGYSLKDVAYRRCGIELDKSVRGEIIWRGLDESVINYAASDVKHLGKIFNSQVEDLKKIPNAFVGAKIECDFVPSLAYMEWCGIKLDIKKWSEKMQNDKANLNKAVNELNNYCIEKPELKQFITVNNQGDLFTGFDLTPKFGVDWQKKEAIKVFQLLGFNTKSISKTTGKETDSVLEKNLKIQKGIDDKFLELYFKYQEYYKVTTSFGQGHLDAVNPLTGRIHTVFKQLGAASGRLSCGSQEENTDLAKLKGIPASRCTFPNLQQLPADEQTRGSFVAPEGYLMVSADFSAEESRLGADIYQDKEMLKEFLEGSGDMHSLFAWMVFRKECEELGCIGVQDVKKKAPQWRKAVKAVEFAWMFGAAAFTISQSADCSVDDAQKYINNLEKGFSGVSEYAKKGSSFVRNNGYITINPNTGHRLNWYGWEDWKKEQEMFTNEFWDEYKQKHKGTDDSVAQMVKQHFQVASKYDRLARNSVTQGTGAIIMKTAMTNLFNWIVENNYFDIVHICCSVHDEIVCDFPDNLDRFPKVLEDIMEAAAAKFCKSLPIPAEASVGTHWIH